MLIDFTVQNYRSIKEPVTLSAIASRQRNIRASEERRAYIKSDSEIAIPYEVEGRNFSLLPVLGIFGANASGKSNVLRALDDLLHIMMFGEDGLERSLEKMITPFRLSEMTAVQPTVFRLRLLIDQTIYTYSLTIHNGRIFHEQLENMPAPPLQNRLLFERRWNEQTNEYDIKPGDSFRGPHIQLGKKLNEQVTFINILIRNLKIPILRKFAEWVASQAFRGMRLVSLDHVQAADRMHRDPLRLKQVTEILQHFDTGLSQVEIDKIDPQAEEAEYRIFSSHIVNGQATEWPFTEESVGTQRLFALTNMILDTLEYGGLLLRDELETSLHPQITRAIVRMFQSDRTNPKRSQLIFTTHDFMLQSRQLLRRDQIWFTRKRPDHSTELYSIDEFKERNDRDIAKSYIDGRYGAVPILPPEEDILSAISDDEATV